jgi:L-aspartate oxidase
MILPENLPGRPSRFLIIGSGIAGLYTALKLAPMGDVTLLTKDRLEESNTAYAQGGIAAAIDPHDSPELHYNDTIQAGAGLCLPEPVSVLVHEGPDRVRELIELGVPFDLYDDGEPALTKEAAHSRRRILHADGDATGREISRALTRLVVMDQRITVFEETMVVSLLKQNNHCAGVLALQPDGTLTKFYSHATILCTGGCGQVFAGTTNPSVATGDGIALAYRAGAAVSNMEFIQFHPTALALPQAPRFLISETVRGEGGILRNLNGERFMPRYHTAAELAPRDIVARSIYFEMKRTGTSHVLLDLSALTPEMIHRRFPNIFETCLHYGLDITKVPIPVAPAAHYMMGGILTDLDGQSTLDGLYACGETADAGVHGANRLASNSLLEGLVFGFRIAEKLRKNPPEYPVADAHLECFIEQATAEESMEADRHALQSTLSEHMGILRSGDRLQSTLKSLETPAQQPSTDAIILNPSYIELQNIRTVAKLMIQSALLRTESRGSHYRTDYPETSGAWRKKIVLKQGSVSYIPVPDSTPAR